MKNLRLGLVVLGLCIVTRPVAAAGLGGEFRLYPSGAIASASVELPIGARDQVSPSLSYEFAERGNNGEHDEEHGGGVGIGAGVDHYFAARGGGWFVGGRLEVFFLDIDWSDPGRSGSSKVRVLQPTVSGGYGWRLSNRYALQCALSLGDEINIRTRGEKVGDGAILLAGVAFSFRR